MASGGMTGERKAKIGALASVLDAKKRERFREWTKREEKELRNAIGMFGGGYWDVLKISAGLDHKNEEQVKEYFFNLMALCRRQAASGRGGGGSGYLFPSTPTSTSPSATSSNAAAAPMTPTSAPGDGDDDDSMSVDDPAVTSVAGKKAIRSSEDDQDDGSQSSAMVRTGVLAFSCVCQKLIVSRSGCRCSSGSR
jgi:hypothetical protein